MSRAIHLAGLPPRGPVYLSIPNDDWAQPAGEETKQLLDRRVSGCGLPPLATLAEIAGRIDRSANQMIILGPDVDACEGNRHAVGLAERIKGRYGLRLPRRAVRSPPHTRAFAARFQPRPLPVNRRGVPTPIGALDR